MPIIRRMRQEDVDAVMAIEEVVVEFPWTHSIFSDCIKVGYGCWVITEEAPQEERMEKLDGIYNPDVNKPNILGYCLLSMAAEEAHILNIIVRPDQQKKGFGRQMMFHMIEQAKLLNAKSIYLEVRVSNQIAYNLYVKLGFSVIGHRKDYYPAPDGREDALVLEMKL